MIRIYPSHKHKLNFVRVPKTASTSVIKILDIDANKWHFLSDKKTPNYPLFCFIRNPFTRLESAFYEAKRRGTIKKEFTFFDFVEKLERIAPNFRKLDEHTTPQSFYIPYGVAHFLSFEKGIINELEKITGAKLQEERENKTEESEKELIVYDPITYNKIKKLYKKDFELIEKYL